MNNTPRKAPPAARQLPATIPGRFAQVVSRFANRVAVSTPNTQWTYSKLDDYSGALAYKIIDREGAVGEPVALLMEHGAPLIAAILGVLKAGRIYLALDPTDLAVRLKAMLGHSRASFLLTDKANASLAHSLADGRLQVMEIDDRFAIHSKPTISVEVSPEVGAWLMYTSGSTGTPKGVWQSHGNVLHHTDVYSDMIRLTPDDRLSLLTSCSLAASATHLFAALLTGATLCPFNVRSQNAERLADWLRRERVGVYHSVPTVFRHLVRSYGDKGQFESIRLIRLGGEPVLQSDVEAYRQYCSVNCILMHAFSSTETGLISALMISRQTTLADGRVSAGQTVRDVEVSLVDERGLPVSLGSDGRITVRSAHLAQGYWLDPDETARAFHQDTHDPEVRLFITGDLGRFLHNGCLEHLGRVDQQVKIRGHRVDLSDVETALQSTNLFEEAVASAQNGPLGEQRLVAYVVPRAEKVGVSEDCRHLLKQSLPDYMIPVEFATMGRLPKTAGGKVNRLALPSLPRLSESVVRNRPMPRDNIEKTLAYIWRSVLGVSRIGRREDFFDLGGTSLQSIEVIGRIEGTFNVALSPSSLVEHGTIEKLAAVVADHAVIPSPNPLVLLRPSSTGKRPLFLVHGGAGNVAVYGQLSRRLEDRPVYALRAVGLRGESWPLMSIPAMAKRYIEEVTAADPTGPYMLAGRCMGGLIAFEMAQQLVRQGRPVGLVVLIDSNYPLAAWQRLRWTKRVVAHWRNTSRILRWSIARAIGLGRSVRWLPAYRHFVGQMNTRARRAYKPAFYPGTITLVMAANAHYHGEDLRLMMARYARDAHTITIPGDFAKLLIPPAVDKLVRQLRASLDAVRGEGLQ